MLQRGTAGECREHGDEVIDGYAIECDFSEEEFASIGKLIWAFCVFEAELARATMWLWVNHESTSNAAINDNAVLEVIEGTMRTRFTLFLRLAKLHFSPADFPLLLHLEERFPDLELTRNRICHGKWHRSSEDEISFQFFDRQSTRTNWCPTNSGWTRKKSFNASVRCSPPPHLFPEGRGRSKRTAPIHLHRSNARP